MSSTTMFVGLPENARSSITSETSEAEDVMSECLPVFSPSLSPRRVSSDSRNLEQAARSYRFVGSARILCIYPVPFHSHQSVFQVLTEELARNGHELVVLTPMPHKEPIENVTEIDVQEISFKLFEEGYAAVMAESQGFSPDPIAMANDMWKRVVAPMMDAQLGAPEMQSLIKDQTQNFDVILIESIAPTMLAVTVRFKAPVILVSSFFGTEPNYQAVGAAVHPLLLPVFTQARLYNLSLWEKVNELISHLRMRSVYDTFDEEIAKRHFGPEVPSLQELKESVHMLFLNVHHIWDSNRPVPPSVLYMGALQVKEPKPISQDLKAYFDSSSNGVVYMSLGSKLKFSDLPPETLNVFLNVFASLPYNVLVKWNGGDLPNKPANVRLESWLPQNDILHHPNLKVFLTQCGLQSTDEAIAAKVPFVGLPVFGDQKYNAEKYVYHGIGVHLDINSLNEKDLRAAIINVAESKSYREKIKDLSRIMSEQRAGGLQRAVYWTEYVARHGARHLRSPLADATLVDYYMLDVLATALAALALAAGAILFLIKLILARINLASKTNTSKLKSG